MYINKRRVILLSFVFCITGCGSRAAPTAQEEKASDTAFHCQIVPRVWDETMVCQTLFGDAEVEREKFETNDSVNLISGDSSVWLSDGELSYQKNENASTMNGIIFRMSSYDVQENRKNDSKESEKVEEMLVDICGIEEGEVFKLVNEENFDASTLQEMCRQYEIDTEGINWEAEAYTALEYKMNYDGISLMGLDEPMQGYYMEISGVSPVYARILLGDGLLLSMEVQGLFDVQDKETITIISQEKAQQIAEEEISELINVNIKKWSGASLEYVPLPDWSDPLAVPKELVPYWCILYEQESDDGVSVKAVRINAITGGDLAYGE